MVTSPARYTVRMVLGVVALLLASGAGVSFLSDGGLCDAAAALGLGGYGVWVIPKRPLRALQAEELARMDAVIREMERDPWVCPICGAEAVLQPERPDGKFFACPRFHEWPRR